MSYFTLVVSTIISVIIGYLRYLYSYWEFRNVKQSKLNFLYGNFLKLKSIHLSELLQETYDEFKGKAKIAGTYIFTKPIAVILDLDLVKTILVKDFNKFIDRTEYRNEENDPLSGHLFLLYGDKWRALRSKLSSTFTSAKMKFMFPTIVSTAAEFEEAIMEHLKQTPDNNLEIYDFMGRYTTDVIGTCAFGIKCNSLRDPNVEFRRMGKQIFIKNISSVRWIVFKQTYANYLKLLGVRRIQKNMEDFIIDVVRDTVETRERENIQRNDFINLLIELKNKKDENGVPILTLYQMAAQVFVFFAAGFETSSSNMTFSLYELAKHPEIQKKLRREILSVLEKHNGELTYEAMMEMTYLDQVISEILRMYPALAALNRIASEDYKIPDTDITLEKGIKVYIPAKAIHYDPEIYDHPHEFRPERFRPEEVQKRHPQSFLGFGDGPRNCIGLRFGRMQVRIGLITLLKTFKFSLSEKSPKEMQMNERSFVLVPGNPVWLKIEKLSEAKED